MIEQTEKVGPKVLELRGYKSLRALNVFHSLMLGLKMLPLYQHETYEAFFARVEQMSDADQEKMIREAVLFVTLDESEIEALISFVENPNGIPYQPQNLKSMSPDQIFEIIVAVSVAISKIKINFVTADEKKN